MTSSQYQIPDHIQEIYANLKYNIKKYNSASVNIPTGTGKSIILTMLISDNMRKNILVLTPSTKIRNSHIDSINKYCYTIDRNGKRHDPKNTQVICYHSLKKFKDNINTWDYVFADEYHHIGSKENSVWRKYIDELLANNPNAKFIGTTATKIRSNGINMSDELFEIESYNLSLTEAIKSQLLPPMKMFGCIYDIKQAMSDKYFDEIDQLSKIKQNLEYANHIQNFFDSVIPEKKGKYIVFCQDIDQMNYLYSDCDTWFKGVDIHKYKVYHKYRKNENASNIEFFEKDNSSKCVSLLFNIDIISEGYHFDDLDGVILYRPTHSIVKYLQLIGRPLSISWKKTGKIPKVIDISNSFEELKIFTINGNKILNLYSKNKSNEYISFEIYKDDKDILDILTNMDYFTKSNEDLFQEGFKYSKAYYEEYGNLNIKRSCIYHDFRLGQWIFNRRRDFEKGKLSQERIDLLESIGMRFTKSKSNKDRFQEGFKYAKAYYEEYGNLNIKRSYIYHDFRLGEWVFNRRKDFSEGRLSQERIDLLESIGMRF